MKEENKIVALAYIEEVVNKRKLELVQELFSQEYVFHGMDGTTSKHIENNKLVPFLEYLFNAFPDLHYTVIDVVADGNLVALNLSASGTHQDEFLGFAATGNKVEFMEMFFFRVVDQMIIEGWGVVDLEGAKEQLGS
jgi:steroid delta-isomerase-like uncharacterized protein